MERMNRSEEDEMRRRVRRGSRKKEKSERMFCACKYVPSLDQRTSFQSTC